MSISAPFLPLVLVAYVVGVTLGILDLRFRSALTHRLASLSFVLIWILHTAALVRRGIESGRLPLSGLGEYLLLFGWAVISLHLLVWFRSRILAVALVLPPVAALSAAGSLAVLQPAADQHASGTGGWFLFHILAATLGMAILTVALAMSLIYVVLDRALKSRSHLRILDRLPSLDHCDQVGFHALLVGFILLTIGIGTGVIVNEEIHATLLTGEWKQTLPLLAWIVFAAVLLTREFLGFRGRKAAYLTITGVALGLLTAVGMTI